MVVVRGRVVVVHQCRGKGGGGCVINAGDRSLLLQVAGGGCVIDAVAVVIVIQVVCTVVNTDQ